jgi:hypothetical protein
MLELGHLAAVSSPNRLGQEENGGERRPQIVSDLHNQLEGVRLEKTTREVRGSPWIESGLYPLHADQERQQLPGILLLGGPGLGHQILAQELQQLLHQQAASFALGQRPGRITSGLDVPGEIQKATNDLVSFHPALRLSGPGV